MTENMPPSATGEEPWASDVTKAAGTINESGQLDLVELVRDQANRADAALEDIENTLNPQIDANTEDNLLMEMLGAAGDARDAVAELRDLLDSMQERDTKGL